MPLRHPVEIIGMAGAGDAFTANFSAFILMGSPVEEAEVAAAINSACVVTHLDVQPGLLTGEAFALRVAEQRHAQCM